MSFDINDLISKDEIQKELEKGASGSGEMVDSRFWRIPDGKSTLRLLPRLESRVPWRTVYSHRYNKANPKIFGTCLKTFNKKNCPICKKSWEMWNSEDSKVKSLGYEIRQTPRYLLNCYIINDAVNKENNDTIKVISVGRKLHTLIVESFNADDLGPAIFDATSGFDFEINRKKSGDNPDYPDYSSSRFVFKRYPLPGIKTWEALKDKLIDIDSLVKEETVEELQEKFSFLGFGISPVEKVSIAEKATYKAKEKPKSVVVKDEEIEIDINDLDAEETTLSANTSVDDLDIDAALDELL